jgi:hypothetical protein
MLQDVVTAFGDISSISVKTRHKDWYFGHSFATGLTNTTNIEQESVSEAINCYYYAWLLSGVMLSLTSDSSYSGMKDISEAALYTEIYASRYFWTDNGDDIQAPSTTRVQAFSKTFDAILDGQPSSYPSKSLYRYSIITYPFTDIMPIFLNQNWVKRFSTSSESWQLVEKKLIAGLTNYEKDNTNSWVYFPNPLPYDNNTSKSPEGITSWGFTGLQLLALGGAISLDEALRYYNKVVFKTYDLNDPLNEQLINRFDSPSNAFYNLYYLSLLVGSDYNELTPVESNPIIESQGVDTLSRKLVLKCPSEPLVEVPTIFIFAEPIVPPDGLDIEMVTFIVNDTIDYSECGKICSKKSVVKVPKNKVITTTFVLFQPECNFNSVLATDGDTLLEKCRNLNSIAPYIIQYTYTKWILSRLLYGKFKLKYLTRSYNAKFFYDLRRSRFYRFIEYFESPSLVDYNGLLYDVIGYGSEKQQGKYYFIK